ncbi:MAG: Rpn family recombination-promoting nuclease/putative transposase [Bacteroidales bacterium]|nr:Rpn family recombination-promoting nuclease/putative transposase [Bacteroidales bacterium]
MEKVVLSASDDILNPCLDPVFKALFTKNTPAAQFSLKAFLSAVLERKITDATVIQNEPAVEDAREKQIRFDVACKFNTGELVDIEMNISADTCEPKRLEYYTSRLLLSQGIKGLEYKELKNTYQIVLVINGRLCDDNHFLHHFDYSDRELDISLQGGTKIITMEASKLEEKPVLEETSIERWLMWFKYAVDKNKRDVVNKIIESEEGIKMATKTLLSFSKDEVEYFNKWEIEKSEQAVALYERSLEVAEERGVKQGIEVGIEQVAKNMLSAGVDINIISKTTGLPVEKIQQL